MFRLLIPVLFGSLQLLQTAAAATTKPLAQFDRCELPMWPRASLAAEHSGTVTLQILVDADGRALESRIAESSGHPALDFAAQEGLERCPFTPGTEDGKPVKAWMQMQYVWRLEDDTTKSATSATDPQLRAAAEQGDARSQYQLGLAYLDGKGVPKSKEDGKQWIRKAAEQGYTDAQATMGMLALTANGAPDAEALGWLRKAAAQGSAPSMFIVGMALMEEEKFEEGADMLSESADNDFPPAMQALGMILINSSEPEPQLQAVQYLERAAGQNMMESILTLAECYATGKVVVRDDARAAKLYSQAAANGSSQAKIALAKLYETGRGVIKNPDRARQLMQEAAAADAAVK